jgi:membrane protein YdfJ
MWIGMAKWLYRLGRWVFHNKVKTIIGGLLVLIMAATAVMGLGVSFAGELSIPGTKSERAMDELNQHFPPTDESGNGSVRLVFKAPDGETLESEAIQQHIKEALDKLQSGDFGIQAINGPYDNYSLNATKEIGYATVTYKQKAGEVPESSKDMVEKTAKLLNAKGIHAEFDGNIGSVIPEIGGASEVIGIIVAFIILLLTFRSMLAAGLPIITAVIGLGIGILLVLASTNFMEMSSISITLAVMLGLAVGIDYALFIISRYRQGLTEGESVEESLAIANATAGSSVVFAGVTVIIALLGLSVVQIPFLTTMGIAAAITVAVAIITAVTIVPALLAMAGERLRPKSKKNKARNEESSSKWGRLIVKYPLPIAIASIMLLLFISIPAIRMETGLPDNGMKSEDLTERRAYDLLTEGYGPGFNGPLVLVAVVDSQSDVEPDVLITEALSEIQELPNIASLGNPIFDADGDAAIITLIPGTGPNDIRTKQLVEKIREHADAISDNQQIELMVTGGTAVNIDISAKLNEALPKFAILIVALAVLLLTVVFRSILIPIKAVLGYLLTLSATLGFIVFVVQEGHLANLFGIPEAGPVLSFLPMLTAGILFGLAMDYEVFLVSRMKEEYSASGDGKAAVLEGMKNSGSVVTAAGLIMVVVFASFIFVEDSMIKSMGLALAFGIFVDAFIVRMTLVPAIMSLMSKAIWFFPKWLDRITPNVDIEGESIRGHKK